MARQSTYSNIAEANIDDNDLLLGVDNQDGSKTTKNVKIGDLKEHINDGTDFTITSYPQRLVTIDTSGQEAESSGIWRQLIDITAETTIGGDDADETEQGTWKIENTGEGYQLTIKNYTGKYYLPSFEDNNITITESGLYSDVTEDQPLKGTVGDIVVDEDNDNKDYFYDSTDESFTVKYEFERNTTINNNWDGKTGTQTLNVFKVDAKSDNSRTIQQVEFTAGVPFNFDTLNITGENGTLTTEGVVMNPDFTVDGVAQINNLHVEALTVFGNSTTPDADFEMHGSIHINAHTGEGLIFGDENDGVEFTVADNDLSIGGGGNITLNSADNRTFTIQSPVSASGNFTQTSGTFEIAEDHIATSNGDIYRVEPNETSSNASEGTLTSIKIGNQHWTVAASGENVTILPGLSQDTDGSEGANNSVNNLFVGTQSENTITFVRQEQLDNTPANSAGAAIAAFPNIANEATSVTIADANSDRSDFDDIWTALAGNERLYFADTKAANNDFDSTAASSGDTTTANQTTNIIYQVTAYNDTSGLVTFARVGAGTINLSSTELKITSIPSFTEAQNNEEILFRDSDDNTLHTRALSLVGVTTGIRYGNDNQGINSITFSGPDHLVDTSTATAPDIDITGRFNVELKNDDFTAENLHCYVLQAPDGNSDKTVSLPTGSNGDSIKFNMQEDPGDSTGTWTITRAGTQKIESDNTLVLDHRMNFELIYSGDATIGWILI